MAPHEPHTFYRRSTNIHGGYRDRSAVIHPKFAAQFRTMNGLTAGPFRPLKKWEQSAVAKAADAYGGFLQVAVSSRFG